jgi:GNAT superfamily N-acetyltransferase
MSRHHEHDDDGLSFSTDRARLDIDLIHAFLRDHSYWVPGIHRELVERSIAASLCFGVYEADHQLGFAVDTARGRGLGKRLVAFVMAHPDLQRVRRFMLATRDAHALYAQYGFAPLARPEVFMERYDADALSR